jgi:hypothetical protein
MTWSGTTFAPDACFGRLRANCQQFEKSPSLFALFASLRQMMWHAR